MKPTKPSEIAIEKVREAFSEFRKVNPSVKIGNCPSDLKKLVVRAVEDGCSMSAMGRVIGVNYHMISRWKHHFVPKKAAKELVLIKEERKFGLAPAVIRLPSGVCIEVALDALTTEFLRVLSMSTSQ